MGSPSNMGKRTNIEKIGKTPKLATTFAQNKKKKLLRQFSL